MTKIITQLTGGLGNQLFQYAAARALAERSQAEVVLDTWSGFVRDFEYRRTYGLGCFPIRAREATPLERAPFWIHRAMTAVNRRTNLGNGKVSRRSRWKRLRWETSADSFDPQALDQPAKGNVWLSGYWQSPQYFDQFAGILARELAPPPPSKRSALDLGRRARKVESVAVGVRLYEETRSPGGNSSDGKIKSIDQINRAIDAVSAKAPNALYVIFCSHRAPELAAIRTPSAPVFVTGSDGYVDPIESLWLMSCCKHHVLTNSTFYWWGAWLSEHSRHGMIMAADNFINAHTIPGHWGRF